METGRAKRACETCRRRRVKCDKRFPKCERCETLGRPCDGYKVVQTFWDESANIRRKYDKKDTRYPRPQSTTREPLETSNTTLIEQQAHVDNAAHMPISAGLVATTVSTPDGCSSLNSNILSIDEASYVQAESNNSFGSGDYSSSAWLIEPDPGFSQIPSDSPGSLNQYSSYENFFDLDVDTYYANGNNACGFIPGAPVILNSDGIGNDDADDDSTWLGSEQTDIQDSVHATQHGPSDRARECTVLLQHFVNAVAPSMDIFDSKAYFGRQLPYKAKRSSMLRLAVAAVAAKHITRIKKIDQFRDAGRRMMLLELHNAESINWHYKAADYYDEGISYLRLYLYRCNSPNSIPGSDTSRLTVHLASSSPSPTRDERFKTSQRSRLTSSSSYDEELLSAIAVFSLYESMNENAREWKQHVAGFYSLLQNIILPRASLLSASPEKYLSSINGFCASFWNIVGTDCPAAYRLQSRTQVDSNNVALWQAMGLRPSPTSAIENSLHIANKVSREGKEDEECRVLLWILAKVMNFLTDNKPPSTRNQCLDKWGELRKLLHAWHKNLPDLFRPYASVPYEKSSNLDNDNLKSTFTQHLFSVPMCAVAVLLYHFAQVLLLINWPTESNVRNGERLRIFAQIAQESHTHSQEICNTALGLRDCPSGQEQMVEPLYMAGICLEDKEDRAVVLSLLRDVQKSVGRSVGERVRELLSTWETEDKSNAFV